MAKLYKWRTDQWLPEAKERMRKGDGCSCKGSTKDPCDEIVVYTDGGNGHMDLHM